VSTGDLKKERLSSLSDINSPLLWTVPRIKGLGRKSGGADDTYQGATLKPTRSTSWCNIKRDHRFPTLYTTTAVKYGL
jgi:hypothetical protein